MSCPQPTADTNRVSLYAAKEPDDCWGDDPGEGPLAPKGYELRMTGESLIHMKETVTSNTIRTDRMRDTVSEVSASAEGDINFELSFRDWDMMLEGAAANNFVHLIERTFDAGHLTAEESSNRFNITGGTHSFADFVQGADVWVEGFEDNTINNGRFIAALNGTATYLEIDSEIQGGDLADEVNGQSVTVKTGRASFADLEISGNNTIESSVTNFLTDVNLTVGQSFRMTGWDTPTNNGIFRIVAISANEIEVEGTPFVVESPTTVVLTAKRLKNGILRKSFLLEKFFGDVQKRIYYPGMRVGSMSLNVESQALVTGTFSFMGKEGIDSENSILGSIVPAGVKDAMNATTNVGQIREGGTPLSTAIRSITLEVNNNLRNKPQVGSRSPVDIGYGFVDVTGTLTAYFEDLVLFQKFRNHTESALSFRFTDSEGNVLIFNLPRLYFSDGTPTAPGGNDDVMIPLEFTAVRDTAEDAVIVVEAIAA